MYTKTCAMCGRTFETKYKKAMFCKGPHYMTCPVCGKTFQVDNRIAYCYYNKDKVCCYKTCDEWIDECLHRFKWGSTSLLLMKLKSTRTLLLRKFRIHLTSPRQLNELQ